MSETKISRTRVKICGIRDAQALAACINAGADAVGFMFYPKSRRYIELDAAQQLALSMPAFVNKVAVFVNAEPDDVKQVIARINPHYLQFHGDESAAYCEQFDRPYIRAIQMHESTDLGKIASDYASASALLVDSYSDSAYGGLGEAFNWQLLVSQQVTCKKPIILAGGLHAENIFAAIEQVSPYAVDVSSGVEHNGRKDSGKIHKFCTQVLRADAMKSDLEMG